jgi:hypothetical protein
MTIDVSFTNGTIKGAEFSGSPEFLKNTIDIIKYHNGTISNLRANQELTDKLIEDFQKQVQQDILFSLAH